METKSRYDVISELEQKKIALIKEREGYPDKIRAKKREIRELERELDDQKEELKDMEDSIEERKETIKELIDSVDDSLKRLNQSSLSQKK